MKTTRRGFTYLRVTDKDCISWGGYAVCDDCNINFKEGYLVFVLNSCICKECFDEWEQRTLSTSSEDVAYDLDYQSKYQDDWYDYHKQFIEGGDE